jgi:Spy/CpxP family protein refolding chaperone
MVMNRTALVTALALGFVGNPCLAQSLSPYAGFETRAIKTLSDQQISDLRAGLGLSLALPAELNGYPGPRHTLELAKDLNLSDEQRSKVTALFESMKAESIAIGERLIAQEADLDKQFADRTITRQVLHLLIDQIGQTQAALRETHLKYHLSTFELLTPAQAQRYAQFRGYTGAQEHNPALHGNR